MPAGQEITLRLTVEDPVPNVAYSLQDKQSRPVRPTVTSHAPLSFDVAVRLADGPRFLGEHVRSEGPARRFIYLGIGKHAGDPASAWDRRAKIDIHDIPRDLLARALEGAVLEVRLPGKGRDGAPTCATLKPLGPWRALG